MARYSGNLAKQQKIKAYQHLAQRLARRIRGSSGIMASNALPS